MNRRKTGIIGAGAVGSILAAHLGNAGHEVYITEIRKTIVDAINESGLHINGVMDLHSPVTKAVTSITELKEFDLDYVFICVKAYILPDILDSLSELESQGTSFVSVQNGLDILKLIATRLDSRNIFRVAVNYAGIHSEPAHVTATFFHRPNYIGCLEDAGAETIEKAKEISALLTEAGLDTEYSPEIKKRVWQKSILNSALMPISVLTHLPMNQIMEIPETRELVRKHLLECTEVARAEGCEYEGDFIDKAIRYLSTAGGHKTSMLMDFEAGNPVELDFLNAKIQEYADKHGIPCELNKTMLALVKGLLHHRNTIKNS